MQKSIRQDLSTRIGLVILCISMTIGACYYAYSIRFHDREFRKSIEHQTQHISDTFTLQLWLFDLNTIRKLCEIFSASPEVQGLLLLDHKKEVIFKQEVSGKHGASFQVSRELSYQGKKTVGYLEIYYANTSWEIQRKNILFVGIFMVLGTIAGSMIFINILLKHYLSKPLDDLQKDMALLAQGDFQRSGLVNQKSEIQSIINAFNDLTVSLRERDKALFQANKIVNRSPAVAFLWKNDEDWSVEFASGNVVNLTGYTALDFIERRISYGKIVHIDDRERVAGELANADKVEGMQTFAHKPYRLLTKNGSVKWVKSKSYIRRDSQGIITHIEGIVYDITEEIMLEKRLQQAQKMEAIGSLAGGIAHDFNNILAVILGYAEMARDDSPEESAVVQDLDNVIEAAHKAKKLVQQILAFSRQSEVERIPIQIQPLIKEGLKMLRSSIPTTISIMQDIDPESGIILADPGQVHQVLMNLCTNAYHAMEETGGVLSVILKTVYIDPDEMGLHVSPGEYIEFTVKDTGSGIGSDVIGKIFNPYFTTKEVGKGTGMGLAIIHGILSDYGGAITVDSELGKGTAFHVYFPVVEADVATETQKAEVIPVGNERILFVDDEKLLADMGKDMLERLGYQVTVRYSSLEALEIFQNTPKEFDLVITDQTMPGITGTDLSRRMMQIRPDIPIILCTGYSNLIDENSAKVLGIKEFALKPLTKGMLAKLIRKVL